MSNDFQNYQRDFRNANNDPTPLSLQQGGFSAYSQQNLASNAGMLGGRRSKRNFKRSKSQRRGGNSNSRASQLNHDSAMARVKPSVSRGGRKSRRSRNNRKSRRN
jgi:hypothetical protein